MSALDSPYFRQPRGRKRPRTYEVTVQYEQDQADFEAAARRMGLDTEAFLVFAGRVAVWLLTDVAQRDVTAEEDKPQTAKVLARPGAWR